jgi:hypothetical protein
LDDDGRGVLVISGVAQADAGTYECTATDGVHVFSDQAVLHVGAGESKHLTRKPSTASTKRG